ncbi:MAG: hypothetical protein U1F33_05415 [Alphaproteobacteria bacterium]
MRVLQTLLILTAVLLWSTVDATAEQPLSRVVLALYDGKLEREPRVTRIHLMAEMPLNHLGLVVRYHDVTTGLPADAQLHDVRAIMTWFSGTALDNPAEYLSWAERNMRAGRRFIVIGDLGATKSSAGVTVPLSQLNRFWALLGIRDTGRYVVPTYNSRPTYINGKLLNFESPLPAILPSYEVFQAIEPSARSYLTLRVSEEPSSDSVIVTTAPRGGYVADGYFGYIPNDGSQRTWYVNPFEFFRIVLSTDEIPKPDTTTQSGRRIYYSHVDGDGWRNLSSVDSYAKGDPVLSTEVLMKEAIEPYHDLPVTMAPIAGDLDPKWYGDDRMLALARRMFALPHVEAGSHTYSHPFDWGFFTDWTPEKERPYLKYYPPRPHPTFGSSLLGQLALRRGSKASDAYQASEQVEPPEGAEGKAGPLHGYRIPRAYAVKPYDYNLEVEGSYNYINMLLPPGKRVEVIQWSGNTLPQDYVVAESRRIGIRNINGGDSRFDSEFPSYAWVAPIGRQVGTQRQIYASDSNENTYTRLWSERFYGFRYLVETVRNTESPIRVKPFNIYYHIYSADRTASLKALIEMLDYARTQEIAPVATSQFAAIADGFYMTRIVPLDHDRWRIENRGELQTIRFDQAAQRAVDYARSEGVLGERFYQGSLYVALDPVHAAPVVALKATARSRVAEPAARPYLVHARWRLWGLKEAGDAFSIEAQGFGEGAMEWVMPRPGKYKVGLVSGGTELESQDVSVGSDRILRVRLSGPALNPVLVRVQRHAS